MPTYTIEVEVLHSPEVFKLRLIAWLYSVNFFLILWWKVENYPPLLSPVHCPLVMGKCVHRYRGSLPLQPFFSHLGLPVGVEEEKTGHPASDELRKPWPPDGAAMSPATNSPCRLEQHLSHFSVPVRLGLLILSKPLSTLHSWSFSANTTGFPSTPVGGDLGQFTVRSSPSYPCPLALFCSWSPPLPCWYTLWPSSS